MSTINASPALPWAQTDENTEPHPAAQQQQQQQQQHEKEEVELVGLNLEAVGLAEGKRIQVRWVVDISTEKETGEKELKQSTKWWPATVLGPASHENRQQGDGASSAESAVPQPVFDILYEKFETFNEERCKVMFTSQNCLVDVTHEGEQNHLAWRHEGDDKEYKFADEEEEEEEVEEEEDDHGYTADELLQLTSRRFKDFLESKFAGQAGGGTVTAEDVHGFAEQLRKRQRQA
ncbi:hypothetical protein DUNSADRAFT_13956 [Dunaliella salina]|uniref:Uncharacterized protein n=1 Tax=Dunaliella salina TaxID=3046 RepID=A0ABQ7G8D2_DUNSA|nr:hypothetical protein DUNSADRAFT_13956 [Dunaliella salina]|eukprot:KAF5830855.1 hypothetical protein DUNSADRAFT_13956 [Dunaliella salina]